MKVPNFELIAEVILLSEGFGAARELGTKLVSLFSLSKQLLSRQQHYDWAGGALRTSTRPILRSGTRPLLNQRTESAHMYEH
jgi:hypothetical protein